MPRSLTLTSAGLLLGATLSFADPGITVVPVDRGIRVVLNGTYARSLYTVYRSGELRGVYQPITEAGVLCTAECFAWDDDVVPGRSVWYRFDLYGPDGSFMSYGPYEVRIPDTPLGIRARPNPARGATSLELSIPLSHSDPSVAAEARILDVRGRVMRIVLRGPLPRGVTTVTWDGKGEDGRTLDAGVYFLHLRTPLGTRVARIARIP